MCRLRHFPLDTSLEYLSAMCPNMNDMCLRPVCRVQEFVKAHKDDGSSRDSLRSCVKPLRAFSV